VLGKLFLLSEALLETDICNWQLLWMKVKVSVNKMGQYRLQIFKILPERDVAGYPLAYPA